MIIFLGTSDGLYRTRGGKDDLQKIGFQGQRIWALHAVEGDGLNAGSVVLAGTYGSGLYRSANGGDDWEQVGPDLEPYFRDVRPDPRKPGTVWAGTEPGRVYVSGDQGLTWTESLGFTARAETGDWYLPYSPRAGAVRDFYFPVNRPPSVFVSVEVGGLLATHDGGETWDSVIGPEEDIHSVTGHPLEPDTLLVCTGTASKSRGELLRSTDGGRSFSSILNGYIRAAIVPRRRPDLLIAAPFTIQWEQSTIYVSDDAGATWADATWGMTPDDRDLVEMFVEDRHGDVWAVWARGRISKLDLDTLQWEDPFTGTELDVQSVTFTVSALRVLA